MISIVALFFGVQLLPFSAGKETLFGLAIWLLALSYLFGAYWLLNPTDNKRYFIPIIAGVAFATSLSVLPFTIRVNTNTIFKILPLMNAGLFLGLSIFLFIKRNEKDIVYNYKDILIRSAVILTVVGFFSYAPVSFKPYRYILSALNNNNEKLVANIRMLDFTAECEDALKSGNCELAITNAEKAIEEGKTWLGISKSEYEDSQRDETTLESDPTNPTPPDLNNIPENSPIKSKLKRISGTFSNLYLAYKCKADIYYKNNEYEEALPYFLKADKALNACDHNYENWYLEQAYSLNKIALCYKNLKNYGYADSIFVKAIEKYQTVKDTPDGNLAFIYNNLAQSLAEQMQFEYSNFFYNSSIVILQRDTSNNVDKMELIRSYHNLIKNHLQTDSLEKAIFFIEETFKLVNSTTLDFCFTNMYYGLYFHRLSKYKKADEVFTGCLECVKKHLESGHQNIAEIHLMVAQIKIALAEYDLALDNISNGIEITFKNYGKNSVRYAKYLNVYAHLDKILGNYEKSEQAYYQVLETYTRYPGERNRNLPEILSALADFNIILTKYSKAKALSDSSMTISNFFTDIESPVLTEFINNAAYVNYCVGLYNVSDSLYKKSININTNYGLHISAQTAMALNGLGLVMTAKSKFKTADSLFIKALTLHKEIFEENHPYTAVVYLNYANLKIKENKLDQAEEMLAKSREINKNFFNQVHDIFADISSAYGNLYEKEKQGDKAKDNYQKALDIYLAKFGEGHLKVKLMREKLDKM